MMRVIGAKFLAITAAALTFSGLGMVVPGVADQAGTAVSGGTIVYRDKGDDPRRARMPDALVAYWADVLHTSRALVRKNDGQRRVRVGVSSRRDFPIPRRAFPKDEYNALQIHVYVDTKGDRMADYYFDFAAGRGYRNCHVDWVKYAQTVGRCHYSVAGDGALQMGAPARMLQVRKHIRWHVWTLFEHEKKSVDGFDQAPDVGMYS